MNRTYIILVLFTIGFLVAPYAEAQKQFESLFGQIPEQTVTLEISADGHVHVIHDVKSGPSSTRYVEFIAGSYSNVEVHDKNVEKVDVSNRPFKVWVEGEEFLAQTLIICTGAEAIWLGAEGEDAQKGRGISTCATCDGAFFRDEEIIVVGGGDSAMEEATFLTRFASKVTIIHRREVFRASKVMYDRAANHPKIEIKTFRSVKKWLSDEKGLAGAVLEDPRDGSTEEISCTGAFIAIGHKPITTFLEDQIETDDSGYIVPKEHTMTSVPGVFAAGDVVDTRYRQAITAAGMGCQAAIDAERWLEDQH